MKMLKVLIVVGLLVLPFLAPGASEATLVTSTHDALLGFDVLTNSQGVAGTTNWTDTTKKPPSQLIGSANVGNFTLDGNTIPGSSNATLTFQTGNVFHGNAQGGWWSTAGSSFSIASGKTTLITGSLTSVSFTTFTDSSGTKFKITLSGFNGTMTDAFMKMIGATKSDVSGGSLTLWLNSSGQIVGGLGSGNVTVPIPPTALLLGAGLIGLAIARKRIM